MSTQEICLVCADPLEWSAVGPCGHSDICSRCICRMRFLLKDNKCVLCKQDAPSIFVTRYNGEYTARCDPSEFKAGVRRRDLHYLPEVEAYFDNEQHQKEILSLCSYTHPILKQASTGAVEPLIMFKSMQELKKRIATSFKLSFCEICVDNRKVFACEQLVYTKAQLERHNREGDETGPLAECSFKGHPLCKFCKQRFYDSQILWRHMENSHEHCFLCRRTSPDKYVYYRHYKELEDHFQTDHYMCPHPRCMDKKFIVFPTDQELKRHFASDHPDELKLTKAQRREAFTVPIQLQFRDHGSSHGTGTSEDAMVAAMMERPGVVLGGGQGVSSRHGPRGGAMYHSHSEPRLAVAAQGNAQAGQDDASSRESSNVPSVTFSASDFPSVSSVNLTSASSGMGGPSVQQAGIQGFSWATAVATEFPALPSLSKAARKRLEARRNSVVQRLMASTKPPKVLHKAFPLKIPLQSSGNRAAVSETATQHLSNHDDPEAAARLQETESLSSHLFTYCSTSAATDAPTRSMQKQDQRQETPTPQLPSQEDFPDFLVVQPKGKNKATASSKVPPSLPGHRQATARPSTSISVTTPISRNAAGASSSVIVEADFPSLVATPARRPDTSGASNSNPKKAMAASEGHDKFSVAAPSTSSSSQGWACPQCTLINNDTASYCDACHFQKDVKVKQSGKGKNKGTVISICQSQQGTGSRGQQQQHQQQSRGSWSQSGGSKLARSIDAVNRAWNDGGQNPSHRS